MLLLLLHISIVVCVDVAQESKTNKKGGESEKKDVDEASQVSPAERFRSLWHLVVGFRSNLATTAILQPVPKVPGSTAAALAAS